MPPDMSWSVWSLNRTVGGDVVSATLDRDPPVFATVEDNKNGTYSLTFVPPVTGTNQTFSVMMGTCQKV